MTEITEQDLRRYPELALDDQINIYNSLIEVGKTPESELLKVSEAILHEFVNIQGNPNQPMDRTIYIVKRGYIVKVDYEISGFGISRAQVTGIKNENRKSKENPLQFYLICSKDLDYLNDEYSRKTIFGIAETVPCDFYDGMLRLTELELLNPPENDKMLKSTKNNVQIDMSNIRLIHVIGIDPEVASTHWRQ